METKSMQIVIALIAAIVIAARLSGRPRRLDRLSRRAKRSQRRQTGVTTVMNTIYEEAKKNA